MQTITVTIRAPRTVKVRVPKGRTDTDTLLAAAEKARRHIILQCAMSAAR